MTKTRTTLGPLLLIVLLSGLASAEIFKWTDANGKVQYGDQPPPAAKAKTVKVQKSSPAEAPAAGHGTVIDAKPAVAKAKVDMEEARRNCQAATENIAAIEQSGSVTKKDDKGRDRDLSSTELKAELAEAKRVKQSWCELVK